MSEVKIAGAPISWGVCEVPGWGYQLPPDRVLREMHEVGLTATEFGPDGFLPADPARRPLRQLRAARARRFRTGGPARAEHDPVPGVEACSTVPRAGADTLVLAAATGQDGLRRAARPGRRPAGAGC